MLSVIKPAISRQLDALGQKLSESGNVQPWTAFQVNMPYKLIDWLGRGGEHFPMQVSVCLQLLHQGHGATHCLDIQIFLDSCKSAVGGAAVDKLLLRHPMT